MIPTPHPSAPRAWSLALVLSLCCASVGCQTGGPPAWAVTVGPARVMREARVESFQSRLVQELRTAKIRSDFMRPEQIAAMGLNALRDGHDWDAAVLLACASYRYRQQGLYALDEGIRRGEARIRQQNQVEPYKKFLEAQVTKFSESDFDDALGRLSARLGVAIQAEDLRSDLVQMLLGNQEGHAAVEQEWRAELERTQTPQEESLRYPELAEAFRERLVADTADETLDAYASYYLSHTPVRSFRRAALEHVPSHFDGNVVRAAAWLATQEPQLASTALASERAETRSHAAITVGLIGDPESRQLVSDTLDHEYDLRVRLSLQFALARAGHGDRIQVIEEALRNGDAAVKKHAVTLLQWLPEESKKSLDASAVRALLEDSSTEPAARLIASILLGDLGSYAPLPADSTETLFKQCAHDNEWVRNAAFAAIARLTQLDRVATKQQISSRTGPARLAAWGRMAQLVDEGDAVFLSGAFSATKDTDERMAIIGAVRNAPGKATRHMLEQWYGEHPELRPVLALSLLLREDADQQTLTKLAGASHDIGALLIAVRLSTPDADARLQRHLQSRNPDELLAVARVVRLFGDREAAAKLWPLVSYHERRFYPFDVVLRRTALGALLDTELNRTRLPPIEAAPPVVGGSA